MKKIKSGIKYLTICLLCCLIFNNVGFDAFAALGQEQVTQNADGGFEVTTSNVGIASENTADTQIGKENNSEAAKETWTYRTAIYQEYETEAFC